MHGESDEQRMKSPRAELLSLAWHNQPVVEEKERIHDDAFSYAESCIYVHLYRDGLR